MAEGTGTDGDDRGGVGNVHPAFRAFWHPVAWSHEVTASVLPVTLLDEPLVLTRTGAGTVVALADACPHRGAPLSLGCREEDELVCPFHGWRFGLGGAATSHPLPRPPTPPSHPEPAWPDRPR